MKIAPQCDVDAALRRKLTMNTNLKKPTWLLVIALFFITMLTGCDDLSPEAVRQRQHLPSTDFVADKNAGEKLFTTNCTRCHGEKATGSRQGPPLVDSVYRPAHHADIAFHWAVRDGVRQHHWKYGDMPSIPQVSPEEAGHIIAYVRDLQRKAGIR